MLGAFVTSRPLFVVVDARSLRHLEASVCARVHGASVTTVNDATSGVMA